MSIDTTKMRLAFQVYLETGTHAEAVEMASHIPYLLDIIDTQQALIQRASSQFEETLRRLEGIRG